MSEVTVKNIPVEDEEEHKHIVIRLVIASIMWVIATFSLKGNMQALIYVCGYMIAGYDVILEAIENLTHGEFMDEEFLMVLASATAFFINEASEAVMIMVLYQLGEYLADLAAQTKADVPKSVDEMVGQFNNAGIGELIPDDLFHKLMRHVVVELFEVEQENISIVPMLAVVFV